LRLTAEHVEELKNKASESYTQNRPGLYTRYQVIGSHIVPDRIGKARMLAQHMLDIAQVLKQQRSL